MHLGFLMLVVLNLVAGFQALGTLMAVGLMMLPATAARFWVVGLGPLALVSALMATLSGWGGLLLSYHFDLPSGPCIVIWAGGFYVVSLLVGRRDSWLSRHLMRGEHRVA